MDNFTLIDLMRHGACEGGRIFRGMTDVPLSEEGWQQMRAAVQGKSGWQRVLTSPLQRCNAFAQEHAKQLGLPLTVEDHWREIHFGHWEGREIEEVWQTEPAALEQYFKIPGSYTPTGGESILDARDRLHKAWQLTLQKYQHEHLLLVQHGGTIRLLMLMLLNMPINAISQLEVPYASVTRIKVFHQPEGDKAVLVSHNPGN